MEFYEISSLLDYQYMKDKENWEQARMMAFITAKSQGAKIHKMEDLMKFQWEKKEKETPVFISDEKMKEYRKRAKYIIENNILED